MNEQKRLFELMVRNYIENSLNEISEIERKRRSCPDVKLTDVEFEVLVGIAQGRNKAEINKAIELVGEKIPYCKDSYNAVMVRLFKKFEAFTLAHVVYKAMKMGILK